MGRAWLAFALVACVGCTPKAKVGFTTGEVEVVHASVTASSRDVLGTARISVGDALATGADGRARLRLDDGSVVLLDRSTRLAMTETGVALESGRIFVQADSRARTAIGLGEASTIASGSTLALERTRTGTAVYCASGEAVVQASGKQAQVQSGETVRVATEGLSVVPEKAWDDWTAGMAAPWGASGAPRGAIGELWSVSGNPEDPGAPLAIRAHDVEARLDGEIAVTRVETTYFNGTAAGTRGDFRMALPADAIVSRFALRHGEQVDEAHVHPSLEQPGASTPRLEWAGNGWVRGTIPEVPPGEAATVIVEYVEWLSPADGTLVYRYPMVGAGDGPPPLIGEFHARLDATGAAPAALVVGAGATVTGDVVEMRKTDFRPLADLVVEADAPGALGGRPERAYVVPAPPGDRSPDPYLLVRTDLARESAPRGVTLAIVVDTSWSVGPALLDVERAVVDAILQGLGSDDRVTVLAADQTIRAVGPAGLGPVDDARRKAVDDALVTLRAGGASDLGAALERAASALPEDASTSMVVYVGDGWPTVGETRFETIRHRLARGPRGVPRLAAVAVGTGANRYGLAALSRGSAPVLSALDRTDAASVALTLLSQSLKPAVEGVEISLGPTVDRLYPRTALAAPAGTTVTTVGRVRGTLPTDVTVRYRRAGKLVEEKRRLAQLVASSPVDVTRRWTSARVEELSLAGLGLETAVELSARAGLLTPWTAWFVAPEGEAPVAGTPIRVRALDLAGAADVPFAIRLAPNLPRPGAVLEPTPWSATGDADEDLRRVAEAAGHAVLDRAMPGVRRCRDVRSQSRPELTGSLEIQVTFDGSGRTTAVSVHATDAEREDAPLDQCVAALVTPLEFPQTELPGTLTVRHTVSLPPARDPQRTDCSAASKLPLLVRRGIWRARLVASTDANAVAGARRGCELPALADERALMELLLERVTSGAERVRLAHDLDDLGEDDGASFVRRAAVRDAASPTDLDAIRQALLGQEPRAGAAFAERYASARTDEERLDVVRRFLRLSPHDAVLESRLFALLEALGKGDELATEIDRVREDPFAGAGLLAEGAAALGRLGRADEGLRAFGEIVERAPRDPYARAFVGDRLRDVLRFDDATAAYDALSELLPDDPSVMIRLALAHAGAGRLDVATRLLARVSQSEGRADDARLGELGSIVTSALLDEARARGGPDAPRLERRALEVALPDARTLVLVRSPLFEETLGVSLVRDDAASKDGAVPTAAEWAAPTLGLYAARIERGESHVALRLVRSRGLLPARPAIVRVDVLDLDDDGRVHHVDTRRATLEADGKQQLIRLD